MAVAFSLLVGLLLPVALVAWLVHLVRGSRSDGPSPGVSLRRVLQMGFLFAAVCTAASGLSGLLALALPVDRISGTASSDLAFALSLTIVALPVTLGLWRLVGRRVAADPDERAAPAWSLYVAVASTVAVTIALVGLVQVAAWAVAGDPFPAGGAARAVVWGAVWAAHLQLAARAAYRPTSRIADLAVLAGSAVGLVTLTLGAGQLAFAGLDHLYLTLVGTVVVDGPLLGESVRLGAVVAVLGGALWWFSWLRQAASLPRTSLWHAYVLILPILGGLLASVGSAATVAHAVLQWTAGVREPMAGGHFSVLPGALATGIVGAWAFAYHRAVLGEVRERTRTEPERAYEYIGAAVGLVAASAGVAVALVALVEALGPAPLAGPDPAARSVLVTAVTMLLVGGPLWWVFWRRLADPIVAERRSPSRRAYLFLLFGVAGLTAVVSLMVVLFVVLRDAFDGSLDGQTVLDLRVALSLALTAGGVSGYHWTVFREDRVLAPDDAPDRDRTVLIVAADPSPLAREVRQATGAAVRVLRRLDTAGPQEGAEVTQPEPADPGPVIRAVLDSPHPRVLVLVDGDDITVVPYESG